MVPWPAHANCDRRRHRAGLQRRRNPAHARHAANLALPHTRGYLLDEKDPTFDSTIVMSGQVAGSWRRTFQKGTVVIELAPRVPFAPDQEQAVKSAAQRYGDFLKMPVEVVN